MKGRPEKRDQDAESTEVPGRTDRCDQVGFADHHGIVSAGLRAPLTLLPLLFQQGQPSQKCLAPKAV